MVLAISYEINRDTKISQKAILTLGEKRRKNKAGVQVMKDIVHHYLSEFADFKRKYKAIKEVLH